MNKRETPKAAWSVCIVLVAQLAAASPACAQPATHPGGFFDDSLQRGFFSDRSWESRTAPAPAPSAPAVQPTPQAPAAGGAADARRQITNSLTKARDLLSLGAPAPPLASAPDIDVPWETPRAAPGTLPSAPPARAPTVRPAIPGASRAFPSDSPRGGQPPAENPARAFSRAYGERALLSLIVSGADQQHLNEQLQRLVALRDRRHVLIGRVVVVGGLGRSGEGGAGGVFSDSRTRRLTGAPQTYADQVAEHLGLDPQPLPEAGREVESHKLRYSPAWIVRYHGRQFIYEGSFDPERLFATDGRFIGS